MKTVKSLVIVLIVLTGELSAAHEIVGEITPLMKSLKNVLQLSESGRVEAAVAEAQSMMVGRVGEKRVNSPGLRSISNRLDDSFGTHIYQHLTRSIRDKDGKRLTQALQKLVVFLMLEQFNELEASFQRTGRSPEQRKREFWQSRNYFSYLLAPVLTKTDPIAEQKLDRLLNKMLYRVEDRKWQEFTALKMEFITESVAAFDLKELEKE